MTTVIPNGQTSRGVCYFKIHDRNGNFNQKNVIIECVKVINNVERHSSQLLKKRELNWLNIGINLAFRILETLVKMLSLTLKVLFIPLSPKD